jgi:hypothetical protein
MSQSNLVLGGAGAALHRGWNAKDLVNCGMSGGIIAGVAFVSAQVLMNAALGRPLLQPLRLFGSIVLGSAALDPTAFPLVTAAIGLFVHLVLSCVYGIAFLFLLHESKRRNDALEKLALKGAMYGSALWVVNFFLIAPRAFPQFLTLHPVWNGFAAHSIFYGVILGIYVAALRFPEESAGYAPQVMRAEKG